ncbi:hypothetical protein F5Y17DRAFT_37952 [Xylariaceae sp. FL0594]|nr:hypothetical protein F5Y17DRAFT_37952 [Xylariaceae sp. FL0594]
MVHIGFWTNWSYGPVSGLTLTTDNRYGGFLIAFVSIFIVYVTSRLWRILCFIIHRTCSSERRQDTLHQQRQLILRNSSGPSATLLSLLLLLKAWGYSTVSRYPRIWPLIALASICSLAFTAAGSISSAAYMFADNEVLKGCLRNSSALRALSSQTQGDMTELVHDASIFASKCLDRTAFCPFPGFAAPFLPTNESDSSAGCPFSAEICRTANTNLRLDTGYIDSHRHLGLNAPPNERFFWRYVLHCAPLHTENYTSHVRQGDSGLVRYHYGTLNPERHLNTSTTSFILELPDLDSQYGSRKVSQGLNFQLSVFHSRTVNGDAAYLGSNFRPIQELKRDDADVTVVFLSGGGVLFKDPMDDGWYQTAENSRSAEMSQGFLGYRPANAASPLGCVQQMQWCNGTDIEHPQCGPLASPYDAFIGAAPLFNLSSEELSGIDSSRPYSSSAAGSRLIWPALNLINSPVSSLDKVLASLGSSSLRSRYQLYNGIQWPIPAVQWKDDVKHWWQIILATVQASSILETTVGIGWVDDAFRQIPLTVEELKMCHRQKKKSNPHLSFSVVRLSAIFALGNLIIVLSYILEPLSEYLSKRFRFQEYAHLEWVANGYLQLHRLAHEAFSQTRWSRCDTNTPITESDILLPALDISDPEHPVLSAEHQDALP